MPNSSPSAHAGQKEQKNKDREQLRQRETALILPTVSSKNPNPNPAITPGMEPEDEIHANGGVGNEEGSLSRSSRPIISSGEQLDVEAYASL